MIFAVIRRALEWALGESVASGLLPPNPHTRVRMELGPDTSSACRPGVQDHVDLATPLPLALSRSIGLPTMMVGEILVGQLVRYPGWEQTGVAGIRFQEPGYINLTISNQTLIGDLLQLSPFDQIGAGIPPLVCFALQRANRLIRAWNVLGLPPLNAADAAAGLTHFPTRRLALLLLHLAYRVEIGNLFEAAMLHLAAFFNFWYETTPLLSTRQTAKMERNPTGGAGLLICRALVATLDTDRHLTAQFNPIRGRAGGIDSHSV